MCLPVRLAGVISMFLYAYVVQKITMNEQLQKDLHQLETLLEKVKIQGLDYFNHLDHRPTSTNHTVEYKQSLIKKGMGTMDALQQFNERFEPMMVSSSGPRYWGFVTGGTTPAAIVGDWLTSIYDQNSQTTNGHGDISANIEIETIELLLDLFGLPKDFFWRVCHGSNHVKFYMLGRGEAMDR
jgi:hypothetical protein